MIRNASTSSLIASKNGDKEELLRLALHLADRLIEDIIPVIVSSIKDTDTNKEVIRCLVIEAIELKMRNEKNDLIQHIDKEKLFDKWINLDQAKYDKNSDTYEIMQFLDKENKRAAKERWKLFKEKGVQQDGC